MKLDSKHWLKWKGEKDTSNNRVVYPRPWTPAAQTTDPNYLRNRFAEIREDIAWAEAMEKQNNSFIYDPETPVSEWRSPRMLDFVKDPK